MKKEYRLMTSIIKTKDSFSGHLHEEIDGSITHDQSYESEDDFMDGLSDLMADQLLEEGGIFDELPAEEQEQSDGDSEQVNASEE